MLPSRLLHILCCACLLLPLAGCFPLEEEAEARQRANQWVFLAQTRRFAVQSDCAVGVFDAVSPMLRQSRGAKPVTSVRAALPFLEQGRAVAFDMPDVSPNEISEQLMSINLFKGLGLLSSFVAPARRCMDDVFAADAVTALMSPDTTLIYDPKTYAIVLLYRPGPLAFYIRTKS